MKRRTEANIMPEIVERHSTNFFSDEPVDKNDLQEILQAATYAPSAFNGQPWRFYVASSPEEKALLAEYVTPAEREWIVNAPILILMAAYLEDEHNGLYNYWAAFDTGCAWGYLSLEAQRKGYVTHCIGSFDRVDTRELFQIGEKVEFYGLVALGKPSNIAEAKSEKSPIRKSVNAITLMRKKQ